MVNLGPSSIQATHTNIFVTGVEHSPTLSK